MARAGWNIPLRFVAGGELGDFAGDRVAQLDGGERFGVGAPGENPALHVEQMVYSQGDFHSTVGLVSKSLRRVPAAFADVGRGIGVEAQADFV